MEDKDVSNQQDDNQLPETARLFAEERGLVPTVEANIPKQKKAEGETEGGAPKTIYRMPGFDGITSLPDLEERISEFLHSSREKANLSQRDFAKLLDITAQVWGRYERAKSSLDVSRLIVISEILGLSPTSLLSQTAPHLFGQSQQGAAARIELYERIHALPDELCLNLLEMVKQIERLQKGIAH